MKRKSRGAKAYQIGLVVLLSLNFGIVFFDRNALSFLMPHIQPELRLSNSQVGAFTSALSLSWALSCFLIGRVSDALGKRKTILILSTTIFSSMSFLSGMASTFAMLLATRLLMGVAEGGVMPISQALIMAEVDSERRGLAMGVMQNFGSNLLGTFLAPLILVAISTAFGWRRAFFVAGLPGLAMAVLLFLFVKEPAISKIPVSGAAAGRRMRFQGIANQNVIICMALSVLMVGFVMVFATFMPLVLVHDRHVAPDLMSWLMATFGLSSMICSILVPGASDILGRRPVVVIMAFVGAALPLGLLLLHGPTWQLFAAIGLGASMTGIFPIVMATIPSESVAAEHIATVLGMAMGAGELLGGVLSPLLAGAAADVVGLKATLWILTAMSLMTGLLGFLLKETAPIVLRRRAATQVS